eukprot:CAMPEP_0175224486 /NCGR_PEP_ID=MMETSP0093-20121207/21874_1 /TAXON_ID=311494 /ORGANISM="Alexandrium monilatum, Strain CCMP3105" /LENGTH=507 /DNA_ID=CAMNT_0016518125 /DNA_START=27 /DNA_END=1551 /DNA_ORIENTATION=+
MAVAGKDVMASYVKQLLELDESRRRATLENLSRYEMKDLEGGVAPPDSKPPARRSEAPQKVTPCAVLERKMEPAMIQLPPGFELPDVQMNAEAPSYLRTPMATKASYEPEVDNQEISLSRVVTPPVSKMRDPKSNANLGNVPISGKLPISRAEEEESPDGSLVGVLHKALTDLTKSLSPEAANEAQKVLASIVEQATSTTKHQQSKGQDMEAMKWLTQHLEKQQEASVQKLVKLMGANQSNVMAGGHYGGGILPGQPLSPPGLGGGAAQAAQLPLAWGQVDARMQGCMSDAAYLSPMHGGCPTWWGPTCANLARHNSAHPARAPLAPRRSTPAAHMPTAPPGLKGSLHNQQSMAARAAADAEGFSSQHTGETLRMHLRSLIEVDSGRILIVRKINRLGFASPELLKQHYSWYGNVERVLVAHSRVKSSVFAAMKYASRLRPSGLGFIVMSKIDEAEAILAMGQEQIVCGAVIRVQRFERRMTEMEDEGNENEELAPDTNSSEEQQSV